MPQFRVFGRWLPCFLVLLFVSVLLRIAPAHAQILLKPKGETASALRVKSLDAQVSIQGQFATTTLTYVFQNETSERIETDFFYTVPTNATVTYFAYWYGEEKVIARVVEKERAAQIYQYITTRQRDPALVEMVGKNTFRARIFPIMPNADLKVEIHLAQFLPSNERGAIYTLPLRGTVDGKGTFEDLNVDIQGTLDGAFTAVGNNFGQSLTIEGNRFRYQLQQKNYRAPRDLEIILTPRKMPLRAVSLARLAGGKDGFFAVALTPDMALRHPKIKISGIKTYDLAPRNVAPVKAGNTFLLTGRYKGSGAAALEVRDGKKSWKNTLLLSNVREENNLATKLWAARRIADLSGHSKNKNAVMALSQRFTLPSKWTSWLAIPQEEAERYRQEKAAADMDYYGRLLAVEWSQGRGKSNTAKTLRTRFEQAAKLVGDSSGEALANWATSRLDDLSYNYENVRGREKSRMRTEMRGLAKIAGVNANDYFNRARLEAARDAENEKRDNQLNQLSTQLSHELMQKGDTVRAQKLYKKLSALSRKYQRSQDDYMSGKVSDQGRALAKELVLLRLQEQPDTKRTSRLEWRLKLLSKYTDSTLQQWTDGAEQEVLGYGVYNEARELVALQHGENPNQQRLDELQKKFTLYEKRTHLYRDALSGAKSSWAHDEMHRTATWLAQEKIKPTPDQGLIAKWQKQFDVALSQAEDAPKEIEQKKLFAQHFHDMAQREPFNSAITKMQQALNPDSSLSTTQRTEQLQQGRQDYERVRKVFGENEPNPLESSDMRLLLNDAPNSSDEKRQEVTQKLYQFMRWGDPLISIEAPSDAAQVIAILPGGEIKKLVLVGSKWQARFDIPTYAPEGDFPITVVIVMRDGSRRQMSLHFKVDGTAPTGNAKVFSDNGTLRLSLDAENDVTRVAALLPWGDKIELSPASGKPHQFFGLAPLPANQTMDSLAVTYVLTDRAHNRTTITVDMEQ